MTGEEMEELLRLQRENETLRAEIERLRALVDAVGEKVCQTALRLQRRMESEERRGELHTRVLASPAHAMQILALPPERIDHNGECLDCDEQGSHRFDCPWLVAVRAALHRP